MARNQGDDVATILNALAKLPPTDSSRIAQANAILGLGDGLRRAKKNLGDIAKQIGGPTANLMDVLVSDAARIALDRDRSLAARLNAVELLSFISYEAAKSSLVQLLEAQEPRELQLAAAKSLAGYAKSDVAPVFFQNWNRHTPALRNEMIDLLLARPERITSVLDAVEQGLVPLSQISSVRRVQLIANKDPSIQARATKLFASERPSPRAEVLKSYQSVLTLTADQRRGKLVFERECIACHRLGDKGHDIGPNLVTIRHRTPQEVLTHILDPNREVGPNFVQYIVETDDGRSFAGVIAEETATSITVKRAENVVDQILRNNIETIVNTGKSLMPEGLEKNIPPQDMSDLLRYVLGK